MLKRAAKDAKLSPHIIQTLFPKGPAQAAAAFFQQGDMKLLTLTPPQEDKLQTRLASAITTRLKINDPHKETARRAAASLALPLHATQGMTALLNTSDALWKAAGDKSADFSFYTKRAILAGIYAQILLIYFGARGSDSEYVAQYAERRLKDAVQIGASLRQATTLTTNNIPSTLLDALAKLRYPPRPPKEPPEPPEPPEERG